MLIVPKICKFNPYFVIALYMCHYLFSCITAIVRVLCSVFNQLDSQVVLCERKP